MSLEMLFQILSDWLSSSTMIMFSEKLGQSCYLGIERKGKLDQDGRQTLSQNETVCLYLHSRLLAKSVQVRLSDYLNRYQLIFFPLLFYFCSLIYLFCFFCSSNRALRGSTDMCCGHQIFLLSLCMVDSSPLVFFTIYFLISWYREFSKMATVLFLVLIFFFKEYRK